LLIVSQPKTYVNSEIEGVFWYYTLMQKRHRIFIAINLPHEVKKFLSGFQKKFNGIPAKWTPKDNLHITLLFLGDLTDEELGQACVEIKEVVKNHTSFNIELNKIMYGPDNKIPFDTTQGKPPRMIWASGEKNKEVSQLKNNLEDALLEKINFKPDNKLFSPHVILARISTFLWRQIEPEERPEVSENINISFTVETIEVMESVLKRGKPEYLIIESYNLK